MRKFILLMFAFAFTLGSYAQLSLEGFESTWTAGQGPANWKILQNEVGTITTWAQSPTTNPSITPYQGVYAAYLNRENVGSGIPADYLVTPLFNVPVNPELRFYSRLTQIGDQGSIYKVKILPEGANADDISNYIELQSWTELEINPAQTEYREIKVDIPQAYVGTQARIAFVMLGDEGDRWLIDNVQVTALCVAPGNLSAANATLTSAELNWNNPSGATEWEIEIAPDTAATTGAGQLYTGSLPYLASGLTFNTDYKYFVRAKCGDGGISEWVGPFYFSTQNYGESCANPLVINNLPYSAPGNTANFADNYEGFPGNQCVDFPGNYLSGNDVVYSYTATFNGNITIKAEDLTNNTGGMFVYTSCGAIGNNCYAGDTAAYSNAMAINSMPVTSGTTYYIVLSCQYNLFMEYNLYIQQEFCESPITLAAANPTLNTIDVSWQEAGAATSWQYKIQPYGAGLPVGNGINVNTTTLTASGLAPTTFYDIYTRANCNDGTFSSWAGPLKTHTACGPVGLPFAEGFNGNSLTEYCWTTIDNNNDGNFWNTNAGYNFFEGDQSVVYYAGTTNDDYLITPQVLLTGNQRLRFYYKNPQIQPVSFSVSLSTTGTAPEDFTTVLVPETNHSQGEYVEKIVNLSSLPSGPVYIAWHFQGAQPGTQLHLDNINIEDHPPCSQPSDVTLENTGTTTAEFTWLPGNTENTWEILVQSPFGSVPTNSTTGTTVTATGYTKTGLAPNTAYAVYVRSVCGGSNGNSLWTGPLQFRTDCPVLDAPYQETFNVISDTRYCWQVLNTNNNLSNSWDYSNDFLSDQVMSVYDGESSDDMLISPNINLTGNQRLKYLYSTSGSGGFKVLLSTTGRNPEDFTEVLLPDTAYTNTAYIEKKISLAAYTGPVYIAFQTLPGTDSTGNININNVVIEDFPICTEPLDLVTGIMTDTTAELSWTPGNNEQDWEVLVQAPGGDVPTATSTGEAAPDTTFIKSGLASNTAYEYYVRSACGPNGNSVWMGPMGFKTECASFDVPFHEGFNTDSSSLACWEILNVDNDSNFWQQSYDPFEGDRAMYVYDDAVNNDWLVSPQINLTGNQRLKFYHKSSQEASAFSLLLSTTGKNPEDFTQVLLPETLYNATGNFIQKKISLAGYSGPVYIAWVVTNGGPWSTPMVIDDVVIEDQPLCTEPVDLVLGEVTTFTAQVSWTQGFGETNWQVLVQPKDGPVPTAASIGEPATATTFTKTGLSDNTSYEFYVRSDCEASGNGSSVWIGPVTFTTLCAPFDVPYFEGFEPDSTSQACWGIINVNQDAGWNMDVITSSVYPNQQASIDTANPDNDDWLVSPQINLTGNQRLKFDQRSLGTTGYSVLISTTGKNPEDFTNVLLAAAPYTNTVYEKRIISIETYTGPVYIAFKAGAGFDYPSSVYIDNVLIEDIPSCPEPYNLVAGDVTQTSASLSWTAGATETQWEVFVQLSNGLPPSGQGIITNTIPFTATLPNGQSLQPGTGYDYYVRAICSDDNKSQWSEPLKFITIISNDECDTAVVVPVNNTTSCEVFATGTVNGATTSSQASPCYDLRFNDVWFKFTATATLHTVALNDIHGNYESLTFAIYKGNCGALELINPCIVSTNDPALVETAVLRNITVGETYYIRVSAKNSDPSYEINTTFTVCVKSPVQPIVVSTTQYTVDNLVKEVLIHSECDQISNITWSSGDSFNDKTGIGYFEKNGSDFPFESGIIISTGDAEKAPGPNYGNQSGNNYNWSGDADLDAVILEAIGEDIESKNASIIEFDFVPATSIMSFDFIFASEEYGEYQCEWSDSFAFILTDSNGVSKNLALVPGTTDPISIATIRNSAYNPECGSVNPSYFASFTGAEGYEDLAATQFNGLTVPLTATSAVVPNTQYHIKMVIADRVDTKVDSAIFLKAGSFSIGSPDLGNDLLVESSNALCVGENHTIVSALNPDDYDFEWKKDETIITGETGPNLTITTPGTYYLKASLPGTDCFSVADVRVEYYPDVNIETGNPVQLTECNATGFAEFDLSPNTTAILNGSEASVYAISYHTSMENATAGTDPLSLNFTNTVQSEQLIYAKIVNTITGCSAIKSFKLVVQDLTPQFTIENDFSICEGSTGNITVVAGNYNPDEVTYAWKLNDNELTFTTKSIEISEAGVYEVTVNNKGCAFSKTVTVTIVKPPVAQKPEDIIACGSYVLPALNPGNRYFSGSGATGVELSEGDTIHESTILYVFAENALTPNCTGESSFSITINPTPAFTLGGPYTACNAQDLTISVTAENFDTGLATYAWTLDGNAVEGDSASLVATGFGSYAVTVTVNGCSSVKTVDVVKDTTVVALAFEEGCNDNDEYILKVISVDGSFDPETASYSWTGTDGFTSDKQEFVVPVKGTYIVTVTTDNGCIGEDFAEVLQTYCEIPKGISPNGDGMNDNFDLSGLDVELVEIFNRYGQEVYSQSNYTNQWHGQSKKGDELPTGTYYYMIQRQNGETKTGWVYINRQD